MTRFLAILAICVLSLGCAEEQEDFSPPPPSMAESQRMSGNLDFTDLPRSEYSESDPLGVDEKFYSVFCDGFHPPCPNEMDYEAVSDYFQARSKGGVLHVSRRVGGPAAEYLAAKISEDIGNRASNSELATLAERLDQSPILRAFRDSFVEVDCLDTTAPCLSSSEFRFLVQLDASILASAAETADVQPVIQTLVDEAAYVRPGGYNLKSLVESLSEILGEQLLPPGEDGPNTD